MSLLALTDLLHQLGDPFFALDGGGRLIYHNPPAARLLADWFGRPSAPLDAPIPLEQLFPALSESPLAELLMRARTGGEPAVTRLATPGGRSVEVRIWPAPEGVAVLCVEQAAELPVAPADLLESIGELFVACDREWRITYMNARAEQYLEPIGLTRAQVLGRIIWEAVPGMAATPFHHAALRAVAEGVEVEVEAEFAPLKRWFVSRIAPTRDGVVSYTRDITPRKEAEAAAHQSYGLLRAIVDATSDSIYVKDLDGRYVMANGAVARGMRRDLGEIIGRTDFDLFPADTAQVFRDHDLAVFHSGTTATFEEPVELPDGRRRIHLSTKGVYRDQSGRALGIVGISRDITRRKAHEEVLAASEARFRSLVQSIDDLVYELDPDQRIVSVFGRWLEREGLTARELVGQPVEALLGTAGSAVHRDANARALAGEPVVYEWALHQPGGARYLQLSLSPVRNSEGATVGLVGLGREITDRVRAERRQHFMTEASAVLGASIEYEVTLATLARLVVPTLADYCLIDLLQPDGTTQRVEFAHIDSDKERRLAGQARRHPPGLQWPQSPIAQALRDGQPIYLPEVDSATVAGFAHDDDHRAYLAELAPVSILSAPLRARGRILGILTFCYSESGRHYGPADLALALELADRAALAVDNARLYRSAQTELAQRTRAESELRRWAEIFQHAGWGIAIGSADGRTLEAMNPAFARLHGYQPAELVGHPISELFPADGSWGGPAVLDRGAGRQTFEATHRRRDGTVFPVLVDVTPVEDENGRLLYFALNVQDLAAQKRVEEQIRQAQKMEAVGRLAGGVAHDFNNMLMIILGFSDFLLGALPPEDPRHADADEIRKAAERASSLTRQLLTFGRQQVVEARPLDLNEIIRDMEGMLRPLLGERIRLDYALAPEVGRIQGDRGRFEQVLMNLALNARDAMPEGGRLAIATENVEFGPGVAYRTIGLDIPAGDYVRLTVSDSGIGMDAETRNRIFEPFFTTKSTAQNTGLGLATVYGIVQQSGGHIWVESAPGSGTTFRICLPRTEAALPPSAAAPERSSGGRETILVVEDEEAVRILAGRVLEGLGYRVLTAHNGQEALEMLEREDSAISLVLTDVVMPLVGGRELGREVGRRYPNIRVLYMSGYTDNDRFREGVSGAEVPFLQKPFSPENLARRVRQVLDAAAGGRAAG